MIINKRLIIMLSIMLIIMESCISIKNSEKCSRIMEVKLEEPLIFYADLNGDGKDEKVTMINKYPKCGVSSLTITVNDVDGRLLFNYTLSKDNYDYGGDYFIQKFKYISNVTINAYRDLVLIYAGSTPPELYILYCQPRRYTEGHKMIEDEKYDVLDTGILLEEFQG